MIIDGRAIAQKIKDRLRQEVLQLPEQPVFCDILVGDDPASAQYVGMKAKAAESLGMRFLNAHFPGTISEAQLIEEVKKINTAPNICGLIVQLPLPANLRRAPIVDAIDLSIDVDCLNSKNLDLFYQGDYKLIPPTPGAVLEIMDSVVLNAQGKKFVVVGQGELVGRPVTFLLKKRGYDVSIVDKGTANGMGIAHSADVLISAVGKPKLIGSTWIKPGAVVIDAGTAESDGAIVGDVDFDQVCDIASFVSPVPGGVGPVTVAKLLENVVQVAKEKFSSR